LVVIYPQYYHVLHLQNTICWVPNILDGLNQLERQNLMMLRGQVLALQMQVALQTCPAASAPPAAVSPPEVRERGKEGGERVRKRERAIGDV